MSNNQITPPSYKLNDEDKEFILEQIEGDQFKEYFKRYEKYFLEMKKGFRVKSLTDSQALEIAKENINHSFIVTFLYIALSAEVEDIIENVIRLQKAGLEKKALAITLVNSYFINNVDLYIKVVNSYPNKKYHINEFEEAELKSTIDFIKSDFKSKGNLDNSSTFEDLTEKLSIANQELTKQRQEQKELKELLDNKEKEINEYKKKQDFLKEENNIKSFDDTNLSVLPKVNEDETISLCFKSISRNDTKILIRCADFIDNQFHFFQKDMDNIDDIQNTDVIYYKDDPNDTSLYGVWKWHVEINQNDETKKIILSSPAKDIIPIEVISFPSVVNIDELIENIKKGINYKPNSSKIIFAIKIKDGKYQGVLCNDKILDINNDTITFAKDCYFVPAYEFTDEDVIDIKTGLSFYRHLFAGKPQSIHNVKSDVDIVKEVVTNSLSWSYCQSRNILRKDWKNIKEFTSLIPTVDIINKIEKTCFCSKEKAEALLDDYIKNAWKYIDIGGLEDEIITSAIATRPELQEQFKDLLYVDWKANNQTLLQNAQIKIDEINKEINANNDLLIKSQNDLNKIKKEKDEIMKFLSDKQKLADDVNNLVSDKLKKARENVVDFISNLTLFNSTTSNNTKSVTKEIAPIQQYNVYDSINNPNKLNCHKSWNDAIETLAIELLNAGVSEQYNNSLAAFLCAAYYIKQPIILIGPNAIDIVKAFSKSIVANKHGVLCCDGEYSSNIIENIGNNGENIVLINNIITNKWITRIPEIIFNQDIFYVATHPYSENIQFEPKSLYNFMLPLFTELFVDKAPKHKDLNKESFGYFADSFQFDTKANTSIEENTIIYKLGINQLIKNKLSYLLKTLKEIYPNQIDEFLFFYLPISYATNSINELKTIVSDNSNGISISTELNKKLKYFLRDMNK